MIPAQNIVAWNNVVPWARRGQFFTLPKGSAKLHSLDQDGRKTWRRFWAKGCGKATLRVAVIPHDLTVHPRLGKRVDELHASSPRASFGPAHGASAML